MLRAGSRDLTLFERRRLDLGVVHFRQQVSERRFRSLVPIHDGRLQSVIAGTRPGIDEWLPQAVGPMELSARPTQSSQVFRFAEQAERGERGRRHDAFYDDRRHTQFQKTSPLALQRYDSMSGTSIPPFQGGG